MHSSTAPLKYCNRCLCDHGLNRIHSHSWAEIINYTSDSLCALLKRRELKFSLHANISQVCLYHSVFHPSPPIIHQHLHRKWPSFTIVCPVFKRSMKTFLRMLWFRIQTSPGITGLPIQSSQTYLHHCAHLYLDKVQCHIPPGFMEHIVSVNLQRIGKFPTQSGNYHPYMSFSRFPASNWVWIHPDHTIK